MRIPRTRLIFVTFLLILAGLIVWLKIVPSGQVTYTAFYPVPANILGGKGFIGSLFPPDRVTLDDGQPAKMTGDPVYFSVFTPRTFTQAQVTIIYRNNLTAATPIVEAGVLADNVVWRYRTAPLENKLLDGCFVGWQRLRSGQTLLLEKTGHFSTVSDFLTALKNEPLQVCGTADFRRCLAIYNTDRLSSYLPVYQPDVVDRFQKIAVPLRGTHQFYFVKPYGSEFPFAFDFTDLNLNQDDDPVTINIYRGATRVYSRTISDGRGGEGDGHSRVFSASFIWRPDDLKSGVYKLEVKGNNDVVIKDILAAPSALVAVARLRPVAAGNNLSFFTDSSFIQVTTDNPASRQILDFGDQSFALSETYHQFEFSDNSASVQRIHLRHDDVILENNGVFAFNRETLFDPQLSSVDRHFVLDDNLAYVLADYQTPQDLGAGWKEATAVLDTAGAYREKGKYSFILSVPGLSQVNQGNLEIKEIKVTFSGTTLKDKLTQTINKYASRKR